MRILIVGAGIGGMTLAALLDRRGVPTTLIERAPNFQHAGYMLGLWPLGYRVLHGLSLFDRFATESIPCDLYELHDDQGNLVKQWDMKPVTRQLGPNLSCTRPQLIKLLHEGLGRAELRFQTTLMSISQKYTEVDVTFSDGTEQTFDLVVGADGMHSKTRELVFEEPSYFRTGWGGWVWWARDPELPERTFVEHWGVGRFVGAYPTRDGLGIFAGAPTGDDFERSGIGRRERILQRLSGMGSYVERWLSHLPADDQELFFWHLSDVRAPKWVQGRVVLLGDAAAGFLPTAGIGASMAMESAAVLNDELSRTDAAGIDQALRLYVQRRRRRVLSTQNASRQLSRMMFVRSKWIASARNLACKFYSIQQLVGSLAKSFNEPI